MELTIIIPVYNVEKHLSRCLDSIFVGNNIDVEFEVIAVDDGSTDNSYGILQEYAFRYKQLKIYHQENQGQASARNKGIALANGKYLMFVDADDWLLPNTIKKLLVCAEINKTEITFSACRIMGRNGEYHFSNDFPHYEIITEGVYALLNDLIIIGSVWGQLYEKQFIKSNNICFASGIKHEDVFFSILCTIRAKRIISVDLCTYVYCWNEGSTDRSFDCENFKKAIFSDLYIANEIIEISKREKLNEYLRNNLHRRGNSIIVGNMISLARSSYKRKDIVETYIKRSKEYGCYPIKGRTLSWKTTALIPLINQEWLLRILLK